MCGFVVHENYFLEKQQFTAGYCPRCGSPVLIVEPYTDKVIKGATMVLDPGQGTPGRVILPASPAKITGD